MQMEITAAAAAAAAATAAPPAAPAAAPAAPAAQHGLGSNHSAWAPSVPHHHRSAPGKAVQYHVQRSQYHGTTCPSTGLSLFSQSE